MIHQTKLFFFHCSTVPRSHAHVGTFGGEQESAWSLWPVCSSIRSILWCIVFSDSLPSGLMFTFSSVHAAVALPWDWTRQAKPSLPMHISEAWASTIPRPAILGMLCPSQLTINILSLVKVLQILTLAHFSCFQHLKFGLFTSCLIYLILFNEIYDIHFTSQWFQWNGWLM